MIVCAVCVEPVVTIDGMTIHANSWATAYEWHRPEPTTLDALAAALTATAR